MTDLARHIRDIPDFPKPGVVFKDITPLLADATAFRATVDQFVERYRGRADMVLGIRMRWRLGYHHAFGTGRQAPRAFGHYGYGGSGGWADPDLGLSLGFVTNRIGSITTPMAADLRGPLRPRVRQRRPRDPSRRGRRSPSGAHRRRSARHRRDGLGCGRARPALRRPGGGVCLRDRARLPERSPASGGPGRVRARSLRPSMSRPADARA